jgi:rfaE bifunctional protein kinase chain/domain/rfaE bifunctional protein nucleotidyltransferase chain/domain
MFKKILKISDLKKIIAIQKKKSKRIVLCHGVFDILHLGHVNHFEEAKQKGDILIVSVTSDDFVNKGPGRPVFSDNHRAKFISSIAIVDYVIINHEKTSKNLINIIKPNYYVKGPDYKKNSKDITGQIQEESRAVKNSKGKIIYTKGQSFSSSNIINNNLSMIFKDNQIQFLKRLKKKYSFNQIQKSFKQIKNVKVLIIGETIIDRYVFCETVGKSGKEPMLVLKENFQRDFLGGAAAICKQVSEFSNKVTFFSTIGEKKEFKNFIKKNLQNVSSKFIIKKNSPTILKKRYVDEASNSKTLGVYNLNDNQLDKKSEKIFYNKLSTEIKKNDLVIVSDYGHGFISNKIAKLISSKSKFLFINSQINSNNSGQHTLEKFKNANCVLINETEMRHELRDRVSSTKNLIFLLSKKLKSKSIIVTRGNEGSIFYNSKTKKFKTCPAFATNISDKVGAGDAMLSVFSIFFRNLKSPEIPLFFGSLAAANSLKDFGNDRTIKLINLYKIIEHLYK